MKKVKVFFGSDIFNEMDIDKVVEFEFENERDLVEKCLLEEFGSEEKCVEYWKGFWECESMEEVVSEVIGIRNNDLEIGEEFGYISREERFFKVGKRVDFKEKIFYI